MMRWTSEQHEAWKRRQVSIVPAHKAAETEAALREFIKATPIPVLTDAVGTSIPKAGKYRNVKVGRFSSKREARHADKLALLVAAGEITDLVEQPKFLLIPKQAGMRAMHYIADFSFTDRDGVKHVVDAKGFETEVFKIKRKLLKFVHGLDVELV